MVIVRKGKKEDLSAAFELIKELAIYENGLDEVVTTVAQMEVDGFGKHPVFEFLVAEDDQKIQGLSVYYYRYSTWKGKRLWLEDIVVTEDQRGNGIGKLLFEKTLQIARETNCTGVMWQVLDWNEPAINFYKKYNTQFDAEWLNCHLDF